VSKESRPVSTAFLADIRMTVLTDIRETILPDWRAGRARCWLRAWLATIIGGDQAAELAAAVDAAPPPAG
jgi:hypothetical protein